jgi:hypothetical protein
MKTLLILLLLVGTAAAQVTGPCNEFSIAPSPTSTQIWTGWGGPLNYLLVQNVSPVASGCDVVCALGTLNTVTFPNGTLLLPHGGAWLPQAPIPGVDLACSANGCTAPVNVCWW